MDRSALRWSELLGGTARALGASAAWVLPSLLVLLVPANLPPSWLRDAGPPFFVLFLFLFYGVLVLFANAMAVGVAAGIVGKVLRGEGPWSAEAGWRVAWRRLPALTGLVLLQLAAYIGSVIPGAMVTGVFAGLLPLFSFVLGLPLLIGLPLAVGARVVMAAPVLLFEEVSPVTALRRASALSERHRLALALTIALLHGLFLLTYIGALVLGLATGTFEFGRAEGGWVSAGLSSAVNVAFQTAYYAAFMAMATLAYTRLVAREAQTEAESLREIFS